MNNLVRGITVLPGVLFGVMAIRWLADPADAADALGMELMTGVGLSSQMGDVGGFFLGGATMCLVGVITLNKTWLQGAALLALSAALYRIVGALVYGAEFATAPILVEIAMTGWLLYAASCIRTDGARSTAD